MKRPFCRAVLVAVAVVLSCAFCLSCSGEDPDPGIQDPEPSSFVDDPKDPDVTSIEVPNDDTPASRFGYYTVDSHGNIVRATSIISGKSSVTPGLLVEYICDALEDESIILKTEDISVDGSRCIISFTDSIQEVSSQGRNFEEAVLDAISQSILDNISTVDGIVFRIKGQAYSTGNISMDKDAVYMGR